MSLRGYNLAGLTPDILCMPCKNKIKTPDTSINRKQNIQEPVSTRKKSKENNLPDVEKSSPKETPPSFRHNVDYKGGTNYNTRGSDDSPSETEGCVRNLSKEHDNE